MTRFSDGIIHSQGDEFAGAQYGLTRVHEAEGHADLALSMAQEALKIYDLKKLVQFVKIAPVPQALGRIIFQETPCVFRFASF